MKNFTLTFTLLAILSLTTACSSDDDGNNNSSAELTGTWNATAVNYSGSSTTTSMGQTITEATFIGTGFDIDNTLTFSNDPNEVIAEGMYSVNLNVTINGQSTTDTVENIDFLNSGTWSRSGDVLTVVSNGESSQATIQTLTNSTLVLQIEETEIESTPNFDTEIDVTAIMTFTKQ